MFDKIVTLNDVKADIGKSVTSIDKAGKRLVVLTAVLCKAPTSDREALGFKPKGGVVTLASLRSYFRDTFSFNDSRDEAARKLISRATAIGFAVADEQMPSIAGLNSYATACTMAMQGYEAWKAERKEAGENAKSKAADKAKVAKADKAAAHAEAVAETEATVIALTSEDGTIQEMSAADFVKRLYEAEDLKGLRALAHLASTCAASLEILLKNKAIAEAA